MYLYLAAEEGFDQVPEVLTLQNDNGKAKPLENETGVTVAPVFLIRS